MTPSIAVLYLLLALGSPALAWAGEARYPTLSEVVKDRAAREIIEQATLSHAIPRLRLSGNRRAYEFLLNHPSLAVRLARHLYPPMQQYTVTPVAEGQYHVEALGALRGTAHLILAEPGRRAYRVEGDFHSLANLLRFSGRMVATFGYREVRERNKASMESDLYVYLRVDSRLLGLMAKLLTPLIIRLIDRRVEMLVEGGRIVLARVTESPKSLYREMTQWKDLRPEDLELFRKTFLHHPTKRSR